MFGPRYFGARYFGRRYFGPAGTPIEPEPPSAGVSLTEHGRLVVGVLDERGRAVVGVLDEDGALVIPAGVPATEKTGGATLALTGSGQRTRRRRPRPIIVLPSPAPARVGETHVRSGGAVLGRRGAGTRQQVRTFAGGATLALAARGRRLRILAGRRGGSGLAFAGAALRIRILRGRTGGAIIRSAAAADIDRHLSEWGGARMRLIGGGTFKVIRGDDSEDLLLLGFEPEDEDLLILG